MREVVVVIILSFALLTEGCARYQGRPISASRQASAFEARTLEDGGLRKYMQENLHLEITPWPPHSWDFAMLALAAFYRHPQLAVARAQWKRAEAGVITAGGRPNPTLALDPEYVSNALQGISPWVAGLSVDIPIETAGKRGYRILRARQLSEAARLKVVSAAWGVRSRLRAALLDLYESTQAMGFLQEQKDNEGARVRLLTQRLAQGEASQPELNREQILLSQTRLSLQQARRQAAEAHARLAETLGVPEPALRGVELSFDFLDRLPPARDLSVEEVRSRALTSRADILSALAEYAASQAKLQLEVARQVPDIHLGPGYLFDQGDNKWALGLSVSLPVFNQNQGPIAEAVASREVAAARFTALQARVIGEIDVAVAGYRAALQRKETADSLLEASRRQRKWTEAMFAQGEVDRMDLLGAGKQMTASALSRLEAFMEAQRALGRMERAVQGSLPSLQEACPPVPAQAVLRPNGGSPE